MSGEGSSTPHKRSKSTISRAIGRIHSRSDAPVSTDLPPPDEMPADETHLSPTRSSMQSHRPRTSTTIPPPTSPTKEAMHMKDVTNNAPPGATLEQSVRLFKVFEALRSGDTSAISKATKADGEAKLQGTTILHLAIQCAEVAVIEYVLSQNDTDINAKDRDGNTPLAVAASLGRLPVVKLLLEQKGINDSIPNYQGKTALDQARNPDIFQLLQLARSVFIDNNVRHIHQLVASGDYDGLEQLLGDSRVQTTLDINGPELATESATTSDGGSLLHEAARKKDTKLAQLLLLNGADPFRRDRRGKLAQDVTKDDRTRAILKKSPAAAAAQRSIQEKTILGEGAQAPTSNDSGGPGSKESREMKGYLKKWTNYTGGYKLRWFVLEDGVLSYYKNQDDAGSACRGAINMKIAKLQMDPKDKQHFEILGKSSVKYDLKANHQVECKRWFWALNNAIQWAKDEAKEEQKRENQEANARHEHLERLKTRDPADTSSSSQLGAPPTGATSQFGGSTVGDQLSAYDPSENADASSVKDMRFLGRAPTTATADGYDDDGEDFDDDASSHEPRPVNKKDAFSITALSAKLQLDILEQVSGALNEQSRTRPETRLGEGDVVQALASYEVAVGNLKGLLMDLGRISKDHEAYWLYRLEREWNLRRMWEDSMARVVGEQEALESRIGESEDKRKKTKKRLREVLESGSQQGTPVGEVVDKPLLEVPVVAGGVNRRSTTLAAPLSDDESEDEEEFFDAVDAGEVEIVETLPVLAPQSSSEQDAKTRAVEDGTAPVVDAAATEKELENLQTDIEKSYKGYEDGFRKRLKLDADNRPKVGLWGILKSMIGKDMTKMTLPVSFNEPTSLLYRVVEDMEYTSLLDTASSRPDSTERLVYVAGFAASEYAGTIGRVAKPFNPLLGETFEYVRPDQGYRFFIEQVSHHPPIGAAFAESKRWSYYGESSVRSKFYGKSFEFNPLGTWFCHIRPDDGSPEEIYTWKKVTSSVVGIITGNPVVDNYGAMEVRNWTTGEVCYLDFKPRGWKASSAFQVCGKVVDSKGVTRWSIGGRWNDRIYARLTPGYEIADVGTARGGEEEKKAFLVWEAHYRPPMGEIPFNITPFVVTLNDLAEKLQPILPPTDSRRRPDQRAMEEGEYDVAAEAKVRVEEGQRARRRVREAGGKEFEPRWFRKGIHEVTGEEFWRFGGEYWDVRDGVARGVRRWEDEGLEEIF